MKKLVFLYLAFSMTANAASFKEVVKKLNKHDSVLSMTASAKSIASQGDQQGSWGDPRFKVTAKNYPKDSLKDDQTPMTGLEFSVSQKVSLTTKYKNIKNSYKAKSRSVNYKAKNKEALLVKALWEIVIERKKSLEEIEILKENTSWINKILKVSKKLYANGKISQQGLLDIQIRKSELEGELSNKLFELSQMNDRINYISSVDGEGLNYKTIPWSILNKKSKTKKDYRELSEKENVVANNKKLTASKLDYVPDLTIGLGYTQRSNIDNRGDFIGASISFPMPFSGTKYASHNKAIQDNYRAINNYRNYKRLKKRDVEVLKKEIKKLSIEIQILVSKTIRFARNSRTITSKSYGIGNSSYLELLQSELKLQKILLKKIKLVSLRDIKKINLKYVLGEKLYE